MFACAVCRLRGRRGHVPALQVAAGIKKNLPFRAGSLCWRYLSSRAVARKVLSAQVSLTSVFGMGTGGPSPQSTPTVCHQVSLRTAFIISLFLLLSSTFSQIHDRERPSTAVVSGSDEQRNERAFELARMRAICSLRRAGDPYRIRTDVNGVRGHCLNHLTNGPFGAPSRTRTGDPLIKSQLLYQLS